MKINPDSKYSDLYDFLNYELNWHLSRIKFFGLMICALCQTQTVNYQKLAVCLDSKAKIESNLRRIQRFLQSLI